MSTREGARQNCIFVEGRADNLLDVGSDLDALPTAYGSWVQNCVGSCAAEPYHCRTLDSGNLHVQLCMSGITAFS